MLTKVRRHETSPTREVPCIDDCSDGDGSLDAVYPQVRRQVTLSVGAVFAVRTVEGLLPSVYEQVPRQGALVSGAVMTVLTLVGLLPSVHEQVPR